jgi:hypothetical protein
LLGLVTLFVICQALSIDWDMGQRGRQKIAYLEMRRLSGALEIVRTRKGAYPAHIESLRDSFIEVVISEDNYHDRGSAELSWNRIVDKNSPWGYVYDYEPSESKSDALLFAHYKLHADPKERGKSGFRSFYVDDTGPIRWNDKRRATVTDPVPDVDPVLDLHSFWREHLRHWSSRF